MEGQDIEFPECNFWNNSIDSWDNTDCYLSNYTKTSVECSCTHLTTYRLSVKDFQPVANKVDLQDITPKNFIKHPTVWICILFVSIIVGCVCWFNPQGKHDRDRPAIAYEDVIFKSERDKLLNKEQIAEEINYLEAYVCYIYILQI